MDRIHDDNNLIDIGEIGGLVNTISYYKKFCFSRCDVYCMMNCLDDWTVVDMSVRYWSGNIGLYTGIWYNNDWMWVCWQMKNSIIEFVQMSLNTVFAFSVHRMKQKLIGEYIYKSITWWEFMIKWRKRGKNLIKPIVQINDWTFDIYLLSRCKSFQW